MSDYDFPLPDIATGGDRIEGIKYILDGFKKLEDEGDEERPYTKMLAHLAAIIWPAPWGGGAELADEIREWLEYSVKDALQWRDEDGESGFIDDAFIEASKLDPDLTEGSFRREYMRKHNEQKGKS